MSPVGEIAAEAAEPMAEQVSEVGAGAAENMEPASFDPDNKLEANTGEPGNAEEYSPDDRVEKESPEASSADVPEKTYDPDDKLFSEQPERLGNNMQDAEHDSDEMSKKAGEKQQDAEHKSDETSEKTGLSESEKQELKEKTGWTDSIIDHIHSEEEAKVYQDAELKATEVNGKDALTRQDIDYDQKDEFGRTNRERMEAGLAPLDKNGDPIELHHIGQKPDSPLAELTQEEHRGKENYSKLHERKESEVDRNKFNKEKNDYWKTRATMEG